MYYALYLKTENLTPDELNVADDNGQVWLHTGVSGGTRGECERELERRTARGEVMSGHQTKIEFLD